VAVIPKSQLSAATVAYEDEYLFAVNKPSGIHSVTGRSDETLAGWIQRTRPLSLGAEFEHGILQRLDFETQGLVLVAKAEEAYLKLKELFTDGSVQKTYFAILSGKFPKSAVAAGFIGAKGRSAKKVVLTKELPEHGRALHAETTFSLVKFLPDKRFSVVRASTSKGRRHQIRVSASHLGFPLLGDVLYGSKGDFPAELQAVGFYLLAADIRFVSPFTGKVIEIRSSIKPPKLLGLNEWPRG
jgi:23S rRNA-/tRNA-specific pseudouridylate synthase